MRHALLTASLFVATLFCSNASAQTAWVGTTYLTQTNYPGLNPGSFSVTLIEHGDITLLYIDGVDFSACIIEVEFPIPATSPTEMFVSCPPYFGHFTLDVRPVFLQ